MSNFKGWLISAMLLMLTWFVGPDVQASHLLGGEISYKCLGGGQFEFTIKVYRDCAGIPWSQTALALQGPHGTTNLPILPGSPEDISPRCPGNNYLSCNPPANASNQNQGSVARYIFRGTVDLSALGPAPPAGYTFHTTQSGNGIPCCRPEINNSTASNGSQTLVVKMFPYRDPITNVTLTPAQLCDKSPEFATDPTAFSTLNPIDTIYLQSLAFDADLDSTSFGIDFPLGTSPTAPYSYNNGYSQGNPLPGLLGPPLVSAVNFPINLTTGEIVYKPTTQGTFVTIIKVSAFRCGQKIAEVYRDFSLKILPNPPVSPPVFNPSGPLGGIFSQRPPIIESPFPAIGGIPTFEGTFYAGDTIESFINVADPFPSLSGNPNNPATWVPLQQTVNVFVRGSQLATNFPALNNCAQPPCARLQRITDNSLPPNPPAFAINTINYGNGTPAGNGFSGLVQSGVKLVWATDCSNLPKSLGVCGVQNSSNKFQINAFDDNCPIEGRDSRVYTYKLMNVRELGTVKLRGVSVAPTNDSVTIYWDNPLGGPPSGSNPGALIDTVTIDPLDILNYGTQTSAYQRAKSVARRKYSFKAYRLYRRALDRYTGALAGNWEKVDSLLVVDSSKIVDATPSLNLTDFDYMYRVGVVSRCDSVEYISDSLKTIRGEVAYNIFSVQSTFNWDSMRTRNPYIPANCLPRYYIQKQSTFTAPGVWLNVDTFEATGNLPYVYRETTNIPCQDTILFRAGLPDVNGTVYWSTTPNLALRQQNPIQPVRLQRISVDTLPNGMGQYGINMNWASGPSRALGGYNIYHVVDSSSSFADSIAQHWGYDSTSFLLYDPACDPYAGPVWLTVAGEDSCRLTLGSYDTSNYHNTMYNYTEYVYCSLERGMHVLWNHYYRWYPELLKYRVYRSEPAAASGYVLIDSISPAPYDSLNRYIDRSDLPNGNTYCYRIEAVHASGLTSLSNAGCDTVDNPPVRYNHIRRISVDTTTGYLHLKYIFNPIEIAEYFLLQRRIADRDFATIDTFWVADLDLSSGVPTINYVDSSARPDRESYQYRMVVQDVCGISIDTSGTFSNLFLTGEVEPKIYPKSGTFLKWQVEHSWPEGIEGFELHRDDSAVNRTRAFIPVANIVSPMVRQWVDTVPQDPADVAYRALARFQYYLKAVETDPNTEDFEQEEIYSNIFRIVHPPRLFLPSAFVPGSGSNALFKPLGFFLDPNKEFKLELYNRWGQLQFETNDVFGSWDGTNMNGDPLPQDTYVYRVVFTGRDEKVYNLNSSVILIRKE